MKKTSLHLFNQNKQQPQIYLQIALNLVRVLMEIIIYRLIYPLI